MLKCGSEDGSGGGCGGSILLLRSDKSQGMCEFY